MKSRWAMALAGAVLVALTSQAGQTAVLIKQRSAASAAVTPGKWHASWSKCKKYAEENGVPLIAVWSNGDSCGHCVGFESSVNSAYFKNWMKTSGIVFMFTYPGDGGDGKIASKFFHWCRKNTNTAYPFVRIYWPKGKVDVATIGDKVDGNKDGTTGGKKAVAFFKDKLKKFNPVKADPELPYSIEFDPNYTPGEQNANDVTNGMDSIEALYGTPVALPSNIFTRADWAFSGWAKSATGAVAFKNEASVKELTTKSNAVVKLYARWTRMTYGTYYTGVQYTIKPTTYAGAAYAGYKPASAIAGLTWNATKGCYTGKPTKAGTYKVTFKMTGKSNVVRTFVVEKDGIELAEAEGKYVDIDTSTKLDSAITAVSGGLTDVTVTGLPDGLTAREGVISGRPTKPGEYAVTVKGTSAKGQKLSTTYTFTVKEGNAILLNGLAHADELWAFTNDDLSYSVAVKVKHEDGSYELVKPAAAEIEVLDAEENPVDNVFAFANGTLTGTFSESGVYTVTVKTTVDEEELSLSFTVNVLEGEEENSEENNEENSEENNEANP